MAKIKLEFAELHTPLFLGGKNHGLKLLSKKAGDPELVYDQLEKELWVNHGNKTAIIPTSNVVSMTPESGPRPTEEGPKPAAPHKKVRAQVSSPTMHVFEGSGVDPK